jgi:hypothetical protein
LRSQTEELEDRLTDLDLPYESMEELQISRVLDHYGIPFFYRQPTIVYNEGQNELWTPSFTLSSYGGLVVDYVPGSGQPQTPDALTKERIYRYNHIPAVVLGPPDLDKPHWDQQLYEKLQRAYREITDSTRYEPIGAAK